MRTPPPRHEAWSAVMSVSEQIRQSRALIAQAKIESAQTRIEIERSRALIAEALAKLRS